MAKAVIVDAVRTPIGRFGGGLLEHSAGDLGARVIRALAARSGVTAVDEVILGQVLQAGTGANVARKASMGAGLPETVPAYTINQACASGLRAIEAARQAIMLGEGSAYIAGGTESMSNVPFYAVDTRWGNKLGDSTLVDGIMNEGVSCPVTQVGMGMMAEEIATRMGLTRKEADAWALRSQQRARAAIDAGRFDDEIVPVERKKAEPLAADEHPRDTSADALAALRTAFKPDGVVTAGNASGINDGAAAALVVDEDYAREMGWTPRATVVRSAVTGLAPEMMAVGPVDAVRKLCEKMGIAPTDFDLVELNEAFAVQALAVTRQLGLDEEKVNVNGGAVALGHPLGASGARIVVTLLHELEKRDLRLGLATLCVGGGMGMAMAIEREG